MKEKLEIKSNEIEAITKRVLAEKNRRENIYHYCSMFVGLSIGLLLLHLFFPTKIHDGYWLGGFLVTGLLLGTYFHLKVIMKRMDKRSISAIAREFQKYNRLGRKGPSSKGEEG
ncbi:MAG: hypothetical protein AAFZ63_28400 [Bacteroidota bacterium]